MDQAAPLSKRLYAFLFDILVLALVTCTILLQYIWIHPILFVGYFAIQESSSAQATLGKRLFGIKVVEADGKTLSLLQAVVRNACKLLSLPIVIFFIIPMCLSKAHQGLHDLAVDSYVIS